MEATRYWLDPQSPEAQMYAQQQSQKPPGPQERLMTAQAQALMMDGQAKLQKNQVEVAKAQAEMRMRERESVYDARESQIRMEVESLKARQGQLKVESEAAGKVATIKAQKEKAQVDAMLKALEASLDHVKSERDREVEVYRTQLDALIKMMQAHGIVTEPEEDRMQREAAEAQKAQVAAIEKAEQMNLLGSMAASVSDLTEKFATMEADKRRPRKIRRDASGLMVEFDGLPVSRDAEGRVIGIG